jgi:hypothetical protein
MCYLLLLKPIILSVIMSPYTQNFQVGSNYQWLLYFCSGTVPGVEE